MKKLIFVLCSFLLATTVFAENSILWTIGQPDGSHAEFALDENTYSSYVELGFNQPDHYFVVGLSDPAKDWPYILPGSLDSFVGRSFWAGYALVQLPVYFTLDELSSNGTCQLEVSFLDVAASSAPNFRVFVNGKKYEQKLLCGKSGNGSLKEQKVVFQIPVSELNTGVNELVFQNHMGKWAVFDAISFSAPEGTVLGQPSSTLVLGVDSSDFSTNVEGQEVLPLLVDVRHKGKNADLKIYIEDKLYRKEVEEGHTVLEINLPAPETSVRTQVKVLRGSQLLFEGDVLRNPAQQGMLVDYVDQFMGTSGSRWLIAPGPWMPMGMVKLSPDTNDSRWKAGYDYQHENIMGFSHVHDFTMGGLLMMPSNGHLEIQAGPDTNPDLGYRSRIDKTTEKAEVGLYSVDLTDTGIHADLTATDKASMQRYIFPARGDNHILIDLFFPTEYIWELRDAVIQKVNDYEIEGYALHYCDETGYAGENLYKLHFVMQFDQPIKSMGGWVRDRIVENTNRIDRKTYEPEWAFYLDEYEMNDAGAFVYFSEGVQEVKVRTGLSLVSIDQARLNLEEDMIKPFDWNFDAVVAHQREAWEKVLGRIEIKTDDRLQKVKFYTNMYHTLSGRANWSDVNGKWVDMDENVREADPARPLYSSDSYWGTHWNLVQFYNLVVPEVASNWINTFSEMYKLGGWLPIGNAGLEYIRVMIGCPSIPLIVSAWQHGIRDFDANLMYEAMYHQLTSTMEEYPGGGQVGMESNNYYLERGYVPLGAGFQSYVSNTMEYAYQDWCFAQYCKALGGHESEYDSFMKRSENWRNIFDEETGFVRPRKKDGTWLENFSPFQSPGFVESNSWQYTWYVPQNVKGLMEKMGRKKFVERLNAGMETSEKVNFNALGDNFKKYPINHGNQSNMQSCYLFNYANEPWLAQKWARAIQEKYYGTGPRDAYPGDEDQGQMSSWYVMSSIGLFQMDGGCAVEPTYDLGSPRFEEVKIHLSQKYHGGGTFVIKAKNASRNNKYIRSARLNGRPLKNWKISAESVLKGGTLELEMTNQPTKWGRQ